MESFDPNECLNRISEEELKNLYELVEKRLETDELEKEKGDVFCHKHHCKIEYFCYMCNRIICPQCIKGCISHNISNLNTLIWILDDVLVMNRMLSSVNAIIERVKKNLVKEKEKLQKEKKKFLDYDHLLKEKDKICSDETEMADNCISTLNELIFQCKFGATKGLFDEIKQEFGCNDDIYKEFDIMTEKLLSTRKLIKKLESSIAYQELILDICSDIQAFLSVHPNEIDKTEILEQGPIFVKKIIIFLIFARYNLSIYVPLSEKFTSLDYVKKAEKQEFVEIDDFKLGKPVQTGLTYKHSSSIIACLSDKGILCFHSDTNSELVLCDIFTKKMKIIKAASSYTSPVIYKDKLYLFASNSSVLKYNHLEEVFLAHDINGFSSMNFDGVKYQCDYSNVSNSGLVYYINSGGMLCEFDLNIMKYRVLGGEHGNAVFSSTSIPVPGIISMYSAAGGKVCALDRDKKVIVLKEGCGNANVFIPSMSNPSSCDDGLLFDYQYVYHKGKKHTITSPVKFKCYQSILRICNDIFLVFDDNTNAWVCMRILVP